MVFQSRNRTHGEEKRTICILEVVFLMFCIFDPAQIIMSRRVGAGGGGGGGGDAQGV